jgi:uncharacterized protein YjbI with pentapeptide repeats
MANPEHLAKLKEGVEAWNLWRSEIPFTTVVDLKSADLSAMDLSGANLSNGDFQEAILNGVNLRGATLMRAWLSSTAFNRANLSKAMLFGAHLDGAILHDAIMTEAELGEANLTGAFVHGADLRKANLRGADLRFANFRRADLRGANLSETSLVLTNFEEANLTGCNVYGVSAWDLNLEGAIQSDLAISRIDQSVIQVDNLEVAQFIYLLLNNKRIQHVIDTITSKVVLILGRFTPERKAVLDTIRNELRNRDLVPVLFDFEKPESRDLTGTVTTLANLARFVIADLTDPSSVPHELATIIPGIVVPVQAILLNGQREYAMFADLKKRYHWVLDPYRYDNQDSLIANLDANVIGPAEAKAKELIKV